VIDEADPQDVPTRRKALIDYRARLHRRILQLDSALEQRGLLDRRQKLRTQWLQQLGTLIERHGCSTSRSASIVANGT
jgi:hypothetical protein